MRRRDRFAGIVWLQEWDGVTASDRVALSSPDPVLGIAGLLECLTAYGWLVEMEGKEGEYRVRCMPAGQGTVARHSLAGLSYSGENLHSILATAVYEADLLVSSNQAAILSGKERIRWVASL